MQRFKFHTKRFYFLGFAILFLPCVLFAQKELTSSIPKAVNAFHTAAKFYNARQNEKAIEALNEAIVADPKFIEAVIMKANVLSDMDKNKEAIDAYRQAIAINPDFFPNNFYSLGKLEFKMEMFIEAKADFEKFLTYPKINFHLKSLANYFITSCIFADQAIKYPVPFVPANMGDNINSINNEYYPGITADGKSFIFTRRFSKPEQEDFYVSKMGDKGWGMAEPIIELNTADNEGSPTFSPDGQYIFFAACDNELKVRHTNGSCDIFLSKKIGERFNKPVNLEAPVNSGIWESVPSFSTDGRTLYFVRGVMNNGMVSQSDIMVSKISDKSEWSEPVSVGDKINTKFEEPFVFIHPDDQTLYFTSDGHPGMGGLDIFMSRRQLDGSWGEPENLGYPINSINDENTFLVSPDGKMAYFASDRPGGKGGLDLYQFPLYEKMRPKPVTYMKGKVFDIDTKNVLAANFELIDLATGKTVVSSTSNVGNGEFLVALPTGKGYALNVSKEGYLFYSENFELKDKKESTEPYIKDIPMKPIKAGESMVLKNIFFETDKFDLKDESRIEMGKLISFLKKNPSIKFEISGHTDNVGAKAYNQTLSERRAKSVFDYLLSNGITLDRMTSKGYGDSKPVAENSTDKGRAQNRRTEFLITESK